MSDKICALEGCSEPVLGGGKKKFCCSDHAHAHHNRTRDHSKYAAKTKAWQAENKERLRAGQRARYAANQEKMAARQRQYYHDNRERVLEINKRVHRKFPFHGLLAAAKLRATKKGIPFDLDWEWAKSVWTGRCAITGIEFVVGDGAGPAPFSPSIDRIEPSKGYTRDNTRFIIMGANALKGRGTDADMLAIAKAIVENFNP